VRRPPPSTCLLGIPSPDERRTSPYGAPGAWPGADCGVWVVIFLRALVAELFAGATALPHTLRPALTPAEARQEARALIKRLAALAPKTAPRAQPLVVVAMGGASNSGKSTILKSLRIQMANAPVHLVTVELDHYFWVRSRPWRGTWEEGARCPPSRDGLAAVVLSLSLLWASPTARAGRRPR